MNIQANPESSIEAVDEFEMLAKHIDRKNLSDDEVVARRAMLHLLASTGCYVVRLEFVNPDNHYLSKNRTQTVLISGVNCMRDAWLSAQQQYPAALIAGVLE